MFVDDLKRDSAHRRGHHGLTLPEALRDRQAETLAQALLNDDGRTPLQGVDLRGAPGGQIEDMNVRVIPGGFAHLGKHYFTLRVVAGASSRQDELAIEIAFYDLKGADDAQRVFEPVEARDLCQDRALLVMRKCSRTYACPCCPSRSAIAGLDNRNRI